ncbi:DUF294 nucleotidyltransferase-like domain-containing protein [Magnetospira sp. QH-2]|uniref:DUF294 nucleotidyltransferase-like domain-containing protein n=1 Tax=Magnetospira sp. (strain QH-2) TaxID=1288970 RepID=UPI0005FA4F55|nr:DUF294 nucleotidyltransferase-like domain-containing protein [Magnetospira sp. QH-2]
MDIELLEISDFLAGYHPFDMLPREVLRVLPEKIESTYARRGKVILEVGQPSDSLFVVRTGAVETHSKEGQLLARLSAGDVFGVHSLLRDGKALNRITAIEDCLLYMLPKKEFDRLRSEFPQFSYFFAPLGADRLRGAQAHSNADSDDQLSLMAVRVEELLARDPVTIKPTDTVQDAAIKMRDNNVSCLMVCQNDQLAGIFTDRDLRNRVVAGGYDFRTPVTEVMTPDPITLEAEGFAFDAVLTMTRRNISHLPVVRGDRVIGVITNTNLVRKQTMSAVYMVGDIHKRTQAEEIAEVVSQIPHLLVHLVESGATAHNIGHIITSISDAATLRLLDLAEQKLGPPPVPYLWLASGSQARQEQTGRSDQDNCMILHDDYNEAEHGAYFKALSKFVCDGLDVCGYIYCPGEMMAMTDKWRQPQREWLRYFSRWIEEPEPKALMLSCIFFDLRPIWGDLNLYTDLQAMILEKAKVNSIFLMHMVANALTHSPPVGFFRNFVLGFGGEHKNQFDLKHTGVVPIVDIARVNALAMGIEAVNTNDRLELVQEGGAISPSGAADLLDAYEFISITRLHHQAAKIKEGERADNFMSPDDLSHFERSHLRDAFSVVKTLQNAMASAYHIGT